MKIAIITLLVSLSVAATADAKRFKRYRIRHSNNYCSTCYAQPTVQQTVQAPAKPEAKQEAKQEAKPEAKKQVVQKHPAQVICEQKAQYMASRRIRGHVLMHLGFGGGTFEGCGWSSGGMPGTCTPRGRRALLGDAVARDQYGQTYRVRIWR